MSQRVLVVEDEPLIGMDIAQQLTGAGFEVVGVSTSIANALTTMGRVAFDVAVLDVNLGGETSEPIAEELRTRGIPFVVLSGASTLTLPSGFRGASQLSKPIRFPALFAELRRSQRKTPPAG